MIQKIKLYNRKSKQISVNRKIIQKKQNTLSKNDTRKKAKFQKIKLI